MSGIVLDTSEESEVYVALPSRTVWSNQIETEGKKKSIKLRLVFEKIKLTNLNPNSSRKKGRWPKSIKSEMKKQYNWHHSNEQTNYQEWSWIRLDSFTGEFYQAFREELTAILKLSPKIADEGTLPNSFYKARIILILKPDRYITQKRALQPNITDEHRSKSP